MPFHSASCHERTRLCEDVDVDIWYALEYGRHKEAEFHCGWSQESGQVLIPRDHQQPPQILRHD